MIATSAALKSMTKEGQTWSFPDGKTKVTVVAVLSSGVRFKDARGSEEYKPWAEWSTMKKIK